MLKLDKYSHQLLRGLGLLAFAFLIWNTGPKNIFLVLSNSQLFHLLVALMLNLLSISLKTWRWQLLLSEAKIRMPFDSAWRAYAASIFIGCLTPGRLGEISKAVYASQNTQTKVSKVLPSVLIDRLLDFYFLLLLALIGLLRFFMATNQASLWKISLLSLALCGLPILYRTGLMGDWLQRSPFIDKLNSGLRDTLLEIQSQLAKLTVASLTRGFILTVFAYGVFFFQCQLGAIAIGLEVPIIDLILVMSITSLFSLVPISIAGIGTRDAILIILLAQFDIDQAQALAFSFCILVIFYLGGIIIGCICWIWEPAKIASIKSINNQNSRVEKLTR